MVNGYKPSTVFKIASDVWNDLEYTSDKRFSICFEKTMLVEKKKERADIYKDMLACTCQGGGKVRIIASYFAHCEINLIFCEMKLCKKNSENGNQSSRR